MADGLALRRIAVTRPRESAASLVAALENAGARVLVAPAIAIGPPASWAALDAALRDVSRFDWIAFTSANAVRAVAERWQALHGDAPFPTRPRVSAIGDTTAATIERLLSGKVDFVSREQSAAGLAREIPLVGRTRVMFPAGSLARDELPGILRERGAEVERVEAYQTTSAAGLDDLARQLVENLVDALLFASPSSVGYVIDALRCAGADPAAVLHRDRVVVACGGPTTAAAATAAGISVVVTCAFEPPGELLESLDRALVAQQSQRSQ